MPSPHSYEDQTDLRSRIVNIEGIVYEFDEEYRVMVKIVEKELD